MVKNRILRWCLLTLGAASVALGTAGIFLPLLPTTPFILLAAWCFLKSSERAHAWIYRQPVFGKALRDWERDRAIARRTKVIAIGTILVSLAIIWAKGIRPEVRYPVTALLISVSLFIATRNETRSENSVANDANETHWPKIQSLAEDSKTSELRALLSSPHEAKEKIALHRFAIRALMFREWRGKNLDLLIPLGDAAIAAAENAGEVDQANIICFNMSSNLADCWNDGLKRENRHFQKGLEYADRAIEFRKQLKKGPGPFSMAYWAKGAHELSLGDLGAAETDFVLSLRAAHELAEANSKPTTLTKDAAYEVLLAQGYVSIAQMARGSRDAKTTFDQVIRAFEEMKDLSPEAKEDAEICLDQLRYVGAKFS